MLVAYLKFPFRSPFSLYVLKKKLGVNLLDPISASQIPFSEDYGSLTKMAKQQLCFADFR